MDIKENLIVLRSIFYKCFFIGLLFLIIATFIYMPTRFFLADFYQMHLGIRIGAYYALWVSFVGLIKTILIFLFLVPALAIHWASKEYSEK